MKIDIDPINEEEVRKLARDHFVIVEKILAGKHPADDNPHRYVLGEYMDSLPKNVQDTFFQCYGSESDKCATEAMPRLAVNDSKKEIGVRPWQVIIGAFMALCCLIILAVIIVLK